MKLGKSFIFKGFKKELINKFGDDKGSKIWHEAEEILKSLEENYINIDKKESVLPAAA